MAQVAIIYHTTSLNLNQQYTITHFNNHFTAENSMTHKESQCSKLWLGGQKSFTGLYLQME